MKRTTTKSISIPHDIEDAIQTLRIKLAPEGMKPLGYTDVAIMLMRDGLKGR